MLVQLTNNVDDVPRASVRREIEMQHFYCSQLAILRQLRPQRVHRSCTMRTALLIGFAQVGHNDKVSWWHIRCTSLFQGHLNLGHQ